MRKLVTRIIHRRKMARAFVGLGSNLGDLVLNLRNALKEICALPDTQIIRQSTFYKTSPEGNTSQPHFLNAVVEIFTGLTPYHLLKHLLEIEVRIGRVRVAKWGPRLIDLDLLLYNNQIIHDKNLVIPHPLMHQRGFVLKPLAEIAPEIVHPILQKSARELLTALNEAAQPYENNKVN